MANDFDPYYKWLGIPPKDQPPHHYRLLGIELFETDREVIDAAANRLMGYLKDLAVGDEGAYSQQLLNEISRARLCLLKKKSKKAYDQQLRQRLKAEGPSEGESHKPAAKGPPPKVVKRSVPPPAAPPSGAAPPAATEPPAAPKPPGRQAGRFDPGKISPPQDGPKDKPPTDPVKIVVQPNQPRKSPGEIKVTESKKLGGAENTKQPGKTATEGQTSPAAEQIPAVTTTPEVKGTPAVENTEPFAVRVARVPRFSTGRGLLFAWVSIVLVGLVGLTLIIVMSVLLLTS